MASDEEFFRVGFDRDHALTVSQSAWYSDRVVVGILSGDEEWSVDLKPHEVAALTAALLAWQTTREVSPCGGE